MKDWPAQPSILMRNPVMLTCDLVPLNDFLPTGTMLIVPGFRSIFICSPACAPRIRGKIDPVAKGMPRPAMPVAVEIDSMSSWVMPHPIW